MLHPPEADAGAGSTADRVDDSAPPAVLVLDDEPASVRLLNLTLGMEWPVYAATDGESGLRVLAEHPEIGLAIVDQRMPGMSGTEFIQRTIAPYPHLVRVILTGYTDIDSLIEAINAGSVYRYLTKPWDRDELILTVRRGLEVHRLATENERLTEELRRANERLRVENTILKREARGRYRFADIIGTSQSLGGALELVERAIPTDTTVLIVGETGTGKELVARAIHYNGPRAEQPFVSENFGAIASDVQASELFGHRRGAFTGAIEDRDGLFAVAHGGTLFLDEIGDCPLELQTRLLRVLDQKEIRRVGDSKPRRVDVRIIAATHHDLEQDVAAGTFRRDLLYRLNVFTIRLPPLRERREDIPLLAEHFLGRLARAAPKPVRGFTAAALGALAAHDYPGNIRELENEVERAFTLADADAYITPDLLSARFTDGTLPPIDAGNATSLRAAVERFEAQLVRESLQRNGGNQTHTADELGLSRRALIDKLQKYGLVARPGGGGR